MIPSIAVDAGRIHYTADALWSRTRDLALVATAIRGASSGLSHATWVGDDPDRLIVHAELDAFARRIDGVRADLEGVLATLEPDEWARSINGGLALPLSAAGWSTGTAWSALRPLASAVEATAPWFDPGVDVPGMELSATIGSVAAPASVADRLARIPGGDTHVRIDRFDGAGGARFELYLSGTDFSAGPDNPWWVGANVDMLTTGSSESVRAVEGALRTAGVTADTPMVITGHSQGGAIALALAASGRYSVDAVITAGTPIGITGTTASVPTLHLVHPEDPVPALGGRVSDATGTTVIVHTEPRAAGIAAHNADTYRASAGRADVSTDPAVARFDSVLPHGGTGVAEWFVATSARR